MENDKRKKGRKPITKVHTKPPMHRKLTDVERQRPPMLIKVILGFAVAILLTILLAPNLRISQQVYHVGDIAVRNFRAPNDHLVEDAQATRKKIEDAKRVVPVVFDLDRSVLSDLSSRVTKAFAGAQAPFEEAVMKTAGDDPAGKPARKGSIPSKPPAAQGEVVAGESRDPEMLEMELKSVRKKAFQEQLGLKLSEEDLILLEKNGYQPKTGGYIVEVIKRVLNKGLVGDDRERLTSSAEGIVVRDLVSETETRVTDSGDILNTLSVDLFIQSTISNLVPMEPEELRTIVLTTAGKLLRPNLRMNRAETQTRMEQAVAEVNPVYFQLKKGEMILREGDPITEEKLLKLQGFATIMSRSNVIFNWFGLFTLIITILYLGWIYLSKFKNKAIGDNKQLILLSAVFVGNMVIVKIAIYVAVAMSESQGLIGQTSFYYAIPFATGAMLAVILFDMEIAILFSVATFILAGVLVRDNISFALVALVGSLVASFRGKHYRQRSSILATGVFIGLGNLAIIASADLMNYTLLSSQGVFDLLMGFLGGIIVGVVVSGLLPIFESVFNLATDIKMLELSDLNHPLLRELVVQAPGTYHHSVIVGNLAEEAAKHTGANTLFTRVACYYHDVGKIYKPEYFIENQQDSLNRHDKLSPSMSSLILMSHVKEGAELAKEHKLAPAIIDIIQQHHGTSLISYFYNKAKEQNDQSHQQVNEEEFRYHGPKPQSKEAAIVLLADSVEAASRTLDDPTPARLKHLVQRIVNHHFIDGQLDECDLSLRDLNTIVEGFVRILAAIFHQRIPYPQHEDEEEIPSIVPDLDFGGKPAKHIAGKPSGNKR